VTADRAIQKFLDRHAALASPTSKRVTVSLGWKWAEKCCEGGSRVSKLIDPRLAGHAGLGPEHWIERCSKCGAAWEHEAVEAMPFKRRPKEPSGMRVDAAEDRMIELGDLALAIWTTPRVEFNRAPMTGDVWLEHLALLLAQVVAGGTVRAIADAAVPIEATDRMRGILLGADVPPALVAEICELLSRPRQQGTVEKRLARARREIETRLNGG
jgi:hypothetical protein